MFMEGPRLNKGRYSHSSSLIVDSVTQEKIIVVAGGEDANFNTLNSTEILRIDHNCMTEKWKQGKYLPDKVLSYKVVLFRN